MNALRPVYHGQNSLRTLKELGRSYSTLVHDSTRVMNRVKALYRSRGIRCGGRKVYSPRHRASWVDQLQEAGVHQRAQLLYQHLDLLSLLRREAKRALLAESRKHSVSRILRPVPGLGPVLRTAVLLAMVQTPFRFRSKRLFWAYVGLCLVTRVSAEFALVNGQLKRSGKAPTLRGPNPNHQRELEIFKSAASAALHRPGPWQQFYERRVAAGCKPELVRLTVARKLAAVTLHLWKKGEPYDVEHLKSIAV